MVLGSQNRETMKTEATLYDNQYKGTLVPYQPEDQRVSAGPHTNGTLWTSAHTGE